MKVGSTPKVVKLNKRLLATKWAIWHKRWYFMQVLIGLKIIIPDVEKDDMIVYNLFLLRKERF